MTISKNTVDNLGTRMRGGVSDILAKIISNSYDADAEHVTVHVPAGQPLAPRKADGSPADRGLEIAIEDDGHGMTPAEANAFYLDVGADRRTDTRRGRAAAESPRRRRPVMGRNGIGNLAAFGLCKRIEVWSAGGSAEKCGERTVSHFAMSYDDMAEGDDAVYHPREGDRDGMPSAGRGTRVSLSNFLPRQVPDMDTLKRQLARKFSLDMPDFRITLVDTETGESAELPRSGVEIEPGTKIEVDVDVDPGGLGLPVRGWVAYSRRPHENEEEAGVRIYARGRLVSVTMDFGRPAGFAGEHSIRSYIVGEIHADWLDGEEDLVASSGQDVRWSLYQCEKLREWGQDLVAELGRRAKAPVRDAAYRSFAEKSGFEEAARDKFGRTKVCDEAIRAGRALGQLADREMMDRGEHARGLRDLVLAVAPAKMAADRLAQIAGGASPGHLGTALSLFGDAKIADMACMEQTAAARVRAIEGLEHAMRGAPEATELELQRMLEDAPWLINPGWTALEYNETLEVFREAFTTWYAKSRSGATLTSTAAGGSGARPDFILVSVSGAVEIAEIRGPGHAMGKDDFERLLGYVRAIDEFLDGNRGVAPGAKKGHLTLICDELRLEGAARDAFQYRAGLGQIDHRTWKELLSGAKAIHEDFLRLRGGPAGAGGLR